MTSSESPRGQVPLKFTLKSGAGRSSCHPDSSRTAGLLGCDPLQRKYCWTRLADARVMCHLRDFAKSTRCSTLRPMMCALWTERLVQTQNLQDQPNVWVDSATVITFSQVTAGVIHALMDFLGDSNNSSALDVVAFVRAVVEKFPALRPAITEKLTMMLGGGEMVLPLGRTEEGDQELADGTYATEAAYTTSVPTRSESKAQPPFREVKSMIPPSIHGIKWYKWYSNFKHAMFIMTSIIRVGQSNFVTIPIDQDSNERANVQQKRKRRRARKRRSCQSTTCSTSAVLEEILEDLINYADDLGKATGAGGMHEDFVSNLSRISQLTGE
ncbi:hypothetical protein BU15DRAFT_69339 [Melanogaster broomeanus]|nr:hypothetical protein BU15DRAFT_69339 [Melanogaster broomeanus]